MKKDLNYYKSLLPGEITVETTVTEEGFVAEIKDFSNCFTQAKDQAELIEMVNDAVFTYLEIPDEFISQLGIVYIPAKLRDELRKFEIAEFSKQIMMSAPLSSVLYTKLNVS